MLSRPFGKRSMNPRAFAASAAASNFRVGRVGPAHEQVLAHRAVEEKTLLRHDADHLPEPPHPKFADRFAVDQDFAGVIFVKPRQQVHERRFSRARRSHERDRLARARVKA